MVHTDIVYLGGLRCEAVHGPSGMKILTDAPVDNHGQGAAFSPTDLAATSLGLCMLTVMGIAAERHDVDLKGTQVGVDKIMSSDAPRRIAKINIAFRLPLSPDHPKRKLLEAAALACPVHQSLHPDVEKNVTFDWSGLPT
ncbi:MAG: OsmC family protein [Terrimicrobiaceae bacterium]|nr:OsmC family protein [Terrimicrobiaceae bacterium]